MNYNICYIFQSQTIDTSLNDEFDLAVPELQGADMDDINSGNGQIEFSIIGDREHY
jgi:hypothetical protein